MISPSRAQGRQALYRWLDLPRLFTLAILAILLIPAIQPVTDPDFWWHLTTGNWILSHHAIPRHDLYTFTVSDHRWITHEWLSEVALAILFSVGRLPLISYALGLVTALGFLLIWLAIDRRVNFIIGGLALALGVAAANPIWGPRVQMITFMLAALTYLWIQRFCEGRSRALWALPLLMVLWANLHGAFFIAYVFLAVAFLAELGRKAMRRPDALPGDRLKQLAIIGLVSGVAAAINPNLWDIYLYPARTQGSAVQQRFIVEWLSPNFHLWELRFFEAMVFLVLVGLALTRRVEVRQFLLLLTGLGMALQSVRHLSLFVIVAVPPLADYIQQAWDRIRPRLFLRPLPANPLTFAVNSLVLILVLGVFLVATLPNLAQRVDGKRIARDFPVRATSFLAANPPPGHMLNQYGWGGYLIYRLYPNQPVFVFGDAAVTGDRLLEDYAHLVYLAPDQPALLDRYDINWVIFRSDDPLITALRQDRSAPGHVGWFELGDRTAFDQAAVLMRDTPENRRYAQQAGL